MMTIFIKSEQLHEFRNEIKSMNVKHGPFRKRHRWPDSLTPGMAVGYDIDILDAGIYDTFFTLKYG